MGHNDGPHCWRGQDLEPWYGLLDKEENVIIVMMLNIQCLMDHIQPLMYSTLFFNAFILVNIQQVLTSNVNTFDFKF